MRLPLPRRGTAFGALCAVAVPAALAAQSAQPAARRAFTPTDWYRVSVLSAPAVSPDGKRVAFTVQTMVEKENRYHREVWVVPTAGGPAVRFTSPGTESSSPRFSPDGKYLFFTSSRPGGQGGSWALRMDEPGGEATQIAWAPPASASWSRDGRLAVWADADSAAGPRGAGARPDSADPFARTPMARAPFGAITRPIDPRRFDGRHVVDFPYKSNDRGYVPNRREARRWTPSQLWTLAAGDTVRKRVTDTRYSHQGAALSPDGKWIAFVGDSALRPDSVVEAERDSLARLPYDAKRDEAERNTSDIYVVPSAGGAPRKVAALAGVETGLSWSSDGKQIAFVWRPARAKSARLATVDVATGRSRNLLGDWRYEPNDYEWLPNGDLMMGAAVGGRGALFRVSPATGAITEVVGGRRRANGFAYDAAHRTVAYVASSVTRPTELYVAGIDGKGERRLTSFNDALTREVAFSDAERFTYPSVGGLEIEGWLMKPYGYEPGKKYPLVLYIHGGPHSAYDEGWFDEFQNLAATGMFVLYTNPRGSSGYGADFTYSTRGRWGAEDYEDLMKAVDIAARRPDVDSTRMGVTGGSYGGFMTAWVTTRTNRFKAAETDRMISDWTYWYGASDAQGLTEFEFFGKPWDNFAMYDTLSPIRHVTKVRTPTLLVQSEDDFRTPIGNAELWFIALRKQGVPAELVRYPRSTHELSRSGEPWLLVDRLGRLRQWFGYWLNGTSATTAAR